MKRARIFALLLVLSAVCASAQSLTTLSEPIETLLYHIRLKAPKTGNLKFRVYWNCTEGDSTFIDLDIDPPAHESIYPSECRYTLCYGDTILNTGKAEFTYKSEDAFSALLNVDRSGAELSLGSDAPTFSLQVDFNRAVPGAIGYSSRIRTEELTNLLITRSAEPRRRAAFESTYSLMAYLKNSEDIYEGIWTYLDRDIDRSKADLGSFYTLATVANGSGGYDIIYLGGENRYSYRWEPLEVKGELKRTPFIDNFDLVWVTADGRTLRHDTSAAFEAGRAALRLNFPLLNSSLRLRRHPTR